MRMIIDPYTWHRLPIRSVSFASSDTVAVRVDKPTGYDFRAGQYAVARVTIGGQPLMRQYSFSSAPNDSQLELLIQHQPDGVVSSWFCKTAQVGDVIEISQPFGGFVLEDTERPVLLVAGRVGIAPFVSMLRESAPRSHSLLYSVKSDEQVCFPDLLTTHHATIVKTEERPRIDASMLKAHIGLKPIIYVCGSKQFVDGIASELSTLGVVAHDIRRELFTLQ